MKHIASNKEIHTKLLEFMIFFDKFCIENEIVYYLMGGSALGAIRHKGFIPWDDDVDVFMTYDNYQKFIKICETNLDNEKYYFQKENTKENPFYFSRLRMNNTTYIEKDFAGRKDMHLGFFIDIMCLYNTPNNKILRYIQYCAAAILKTRALADIDYKRDVVWKMILVNISKIVVNKFTKSILLKIVNGYQNKNTKLVGHFFGRARFKYTSFDKKWLGKQRYVPFETITLPVQEKVEEYLQIRYGKKYMEIPNQKTKNMYPSHAYIVDPFKDYKEYTK